MTDFVFQNPDEKQTRILNAALGVFARYGYRRSSMEDIAKAAGMSRAALYQHFRNKDDILSHGVTAYFDQAAAHLRDALNPDLSVDAAIRGGCGALTGGMTEFLLDSAHGEELLTEHSGPTADLVDKGMADLTAIWADWLRDADSAGTIVLAAVGMDAVAHPAADTKAANRSTGAGDPKQTNLPDPVFDPAYALAETIIGGLHGQKTSARNYREYLARADIYARMISRSLRP